MTRAEVVAKAQEWIGTPWSHQSSVKDVGCDCIGFVGGLARDLGFASGIEWSRDPQMRGYGPIPVPAMLLEAVARYLVPVQYGDVQLADILLLKWDTEPSHFALVSSVEPVRVIHAYRSARKVCETPIDGRWRQHVRWQDLIVSAWRYRELAD